ncbi:transcriptional regulator [Streptomyces canus]|uniref:transcriptional regulator n=1 Tax=Streptomyces canus TaxID=58343 RepID=UPI0033FB722B
MELPIVSLLPADSPRLAGIDPEHVARLADLDDPLPPVIVDRRTLRVVDGMHRLLAALTRGRSTIDVEFFDGTDDEAFLRAVSANVTHGLPLSPTDRRAAAARIMAAQPGMSDRAIARASGLSAKTVAAIRRRSTDAMPQLNARIGADGKVRPLNAAEGRLRAAEVLAARPAASLREVARIAGISPATVSDVRKRLRSGREPVPAAVAEPESTGGQDRPRTDSRAVVPAQVSRATEAGPQDRRAAEFQDSLSQPELVAAMNKLLRDPSLRHKEEGRHLLRLLQQTALALDKWDGLITAVPPHSGALIGRLARHCAESWLRFAQDLEDQVCATSGSTASR